MKKTSRNFIILILIVTTLLGGYSFGDSENIQIPILMYHHIVEVYNGEETKEIIDLPGFWSHMTALKEEGYNFISINDMILAEKGEIKLPEKPIILTFDDGYSSNYELAFPLLKKYEIKAVMNIVVNSVGETPGTYPHFSWEEAEIMMKSGFVELGSHTFALHNMDMWKKESETEEEYYDRLFKDFSYSKYIMDKNLESNTTIMCFPYGYYNNTVIKAAYDSGFSTFITVDKRINSLNGRISLLGRINVDGSYTSDELINKISDMYK